MDSDGHPVRIVGVHSDITERKDAQVRLERFAHELEKAVETRTAELRHSQEQLRALAAELTLTEQRQRQRFASQLHDHLQQLLVLSKLKLTQAKRAVDAVPLGVSLLEQVDEAVNTALDYSRSLVAELSPPVLQQYGLVAGIQVACGMDGAHEFISDRGDARGVHPPPRSPVRAVVPIRSGIAHQCCEVCRDWPRQRTTECLREGPLHSDTR